MFERRKKMNNLRNWVSLTRIYSMNDAELRESRASGAADAVDRYLWIYIRKMDI
jgi:hypothetical protein